MNNNNKINILIILCAVPHYYNLFLNKLQDISNFNIIYIKTNDDNYIGTGVFQTTDNANFKVIQLEESAHSKNFINIIIKQLITYNIKIIIIHSLYLNIFFYSKIFNKFIIKNNIKIILRTIPFQMKKLHELIDNSEINVTFSSINNPYLRNFLFKIKFDKIRSWYWKKIQQKRNKKIMLLKKKYNYPHAHICYIDEAYDIFSSYEVPTNKIFITRNSTDTDFVFSEKNKIIHLPPILPPSNHRIIHVGRLDKWKNVDMLILSLKNLLPLYPDAELIIIGDGDQMDNLVNLAEKLKISHKIIFTGAIYDYQILGKYLLASNIYVLAGMGGLSINDAMIFELPIICSVCDGTEKFLVRHNYNGLFFKQNDLNDLIEKIKYLFDNPSLAKQMGKNSLNIIQNEINVHTVVNKYIEVFNFVLNN